MDNVGGVLFCLSHGERGNHSGCTRHDTQKVTQKMHLKQSENKACKKIHNYNNHNHRYTQHLLKSYYALGSVLRSTDPILINRLRLAQVLLASEYGSEI